MWMNALQILTAAAPMEHALIQMDHLTVLVSLVTKETDTFAQVTLLLLSFNAYLFL